MTKFTDGPAVGQVLMLRRAPLFLRVAFDTEGMDEPPWDALDQLEDTPKLYETFYAYRRTGKHGRCMIDFGGKKKHLSGMYTSANYEFVQDQPSQEIMGDNVKWRKWCCEQPVENVTTA